MDKVICAIGGIIILDGIALLKGIDGLLLITSIGALAGLGGYFMPQLIEKIKTSAISL